MVLEQRVHSNPGYYLRRYIRRVKVMDFDAFLEALGPLELTEKEELVLARTDVLATGISRQSGVPTVLLVEATWRAHSGDVERQVRRRQILEAKGIEALAVILSVNSPVPDVHDQAERGGIVLEVTESTKPMAA